MLQKRREAFFAVAASATLTIAAAGAAWAQDAVVRGTVKSDRGDPLPGALVYINELNLASTTNATGQYVLTVPGARVRGQQYALRTGAIGYKSMSKLINIVAGEQTYDFALPTDIHMLEAIVVTGVGSGTEQIKVPFAISRIDNEQMPVAGMTPLQQLQGKVAGAQIKSFSGRPGATQAVLIRGPKALNAEGRSQEPLYIVDGVPITGGLPDINPSDIQSVEVVKGAAGASAYGALSGSGVVQITTKTGRGALEQVQFNVRSEAGYSDVERDFGLARNHVLLMDETNRFFCQSVANQPTCARIFDYATEAGRINNLPGDFADVPAGVPVDPGASTPQSVLRSQFQSKRWPGQTYNAVSQLVKPQPFYTNTVDMSGRFGGTSVFGSIANAHESGAIRFLQGYERRSARLNVDQRIGTAWNVALRTYFSRSTQDGLNQERGGGAFFRLTRVPGIVNILAHDSVGRLYVRPNLQASGAQNENPLQSLQNIQREDVTSRFIGGGTVRYTPTDWIDAEASFGYDGRRISYMQFQDKGYRATTSGFAATQSIGSVFRGAQSNEAYNAGLGVTFRRPLGEDLQTRTSLRYSYRQEDFDIRQGQGNTLAVQGVTTLNNTNTVGRVIESSRESERLIGFLGNLNLEYKERYILDGLVRRDGSSLFGENNRWQTFGRISGAWRLSNEPWWPIPQASEVKLRTSYGTSGGRPRFSAQYETFTIGAGGIVSPVQLGNRNLGPERNTELELGTDIELFNRVLLNATYARSKTRDQILPAPVEAATGFTTQWINAGTLLNITYELGLNVPVIQRPNLTWSFNVTYDQNRTWIEQLNVPPYNYGNTLQATGAIFRAQEGERFGTFYGRRFATSCSELPAPFNSAANCGGSGTAFQRNDEGMLVWVGAGNSWRDGITENLWQEQLPATAAPWGTALNWGMPITLRDAAGTPLQLPLGNALPDYRFSISQNLHWNRLTVYALLDASIGQDVWNQGRHWAHLDLLAREIDQEGKSVETAKPLGYYWRAGGAAGGLGGFYDILAPNSRFVETASFAKLREVLVSYSLGPIMGVGSWDVSVVGRNLFTITNYTGFDPEVGITGGEAGSAAVSAIDSFTFPGLRSITVGLSTSF
jgi:TonB-linked SusC/RagA family outer membrane protein